MCMYIHIITFIYIWKYINEITFFHSIVIVTSGKFAYIYIKQRELIIYVMYTYIHVYIFIVYIDVYIYIYI
jgi:hypothetical protein